jgi:hypothetical protein
LGRNGRISTLAAEKPKHQVIALEPSPDNIAIAKAGTGSVTILTVIGVL